MKILVTGGAGYIGSHVVKQLLENTDHEIVVLDNLSTGNIEAINTLQEIRYFQFIENDLKHFNSIDCLFVISEFDTVIHFAASSVVQESMENPNKYYSNNTMCTSNLIKCASKYNVKKFIFSSTAAVYGDVPFDTISENVELNPINPYGRSKLMSEQILQDEAKVSNLKFVIFRYFNVAGADIFYEDELSPRIGEKHDPETHLIPLVVKTSLNRRESITIYGDDYLTPDGTCVRDYIHVDDLASAHIEAIDYLDNNESDIFNCGYGYGYSVKQIINVVESISGPMNVLIGNKREGDPALLVSDCTKIKTKMNWTPKYDDLELICKSAYNWEINQFSK